MPSGYLDKRKSRVVAKGYHQKLSFDFAKTFILMVKQITICVVLKITLSKGYNIYQLDINKVFLNGKLQEEVYMSQSLGFENPIYRNYVCELNKVIYDLKKAPRT